MTKTVGLSLIILFFTYLPTSKAETQVQEKKSLSLKEKFLAINWKDEVLRHIYSGISGYSFSPFDSVHQQDKKNTFSPNIGIVLGAHWALNEKWLLKPEIQYIFFTPENKEYSKSLLFYSLHFDYIIHDKIHLMAGQSIATTTIWGSGGAKVLNDGSSTSTYYLPSQVNKSYNFTTDLGAEFYIIPKLGINLKTYLFELLSSEKRQIHYSLGLNYYF